jgi:cytochrome c oxidase subunit 1
MHGTIMMLLFGTPMVAASRTTSCPLQIGAADMVFPRLNALSFWLFLSAGSSSCPGSWSRRDRRTIGWTGYAPSNETDRSAARPGPICGSSGWR